DQLMEVLQVAQANAVPQLPQTPPIVPATKKPEVLKLLSQAQFAMDQERWMDARNLVDQAKAMNVPDSEFLPDEFRPWQFELKIQNALNRQSFDSNVMQSSFTENPAASGVVQASYDPASDTTANVTASANKDVADSRFNRIPSSALDFYRSGLKSLDEKKPTEARAYFEKAWNSRDQLDELTQQSIQDQLTRLTMSKPTAGPSDNVIPATQASTSMASPSFQQQSLFRKLQSEVLRERASAERLLSSSPREALEKMTMVRGRIAQSELEVSSQRPLLKIIDNDIDKMQAYIEQNLSEIVNQEQNIVRREAVDLRRQRRLDIETQLQRLVEDFNRLVEEERFAEAIQISEQARDLDPNDATVVLLVEKAKLLNRVFRMNLIREQREGGFWNSLAEVEESSIPNGSTTTPVMINDVERFARDAAVRGERLERSRYNSDAERQIWNKLRNEQVQGEYTGTLAEAMGQLSRQAGVNIVFDELSLADAEIRKDQMVDMPIREPISLRSALDVILQSAGLVFVVENEVIKVTTKTARSGKLVNETYYIGDLITPVSQPQNPMNINWMQSNQNPYTMGGSMNVGNNQLAMAQQLGGNVPGNPFANYTNNSDGPQTGTPAYGTMGVAPTGGITENDFLPLIELIQNTIDTESWQENGGLGTIDAFVPNLSLIVSQTQEIQDRIQDLLKKLRELNDVQIVVEVRFVSLLDQFFERVGVDFDFKINDDNQIGVNPNADTQTGGSTVVGRNPVDPFQPTADLDIEFLQGTFAAAEPVFGGFQAATASNFGFAILSDIEVFFLLQASKGNERSNITQAPSVTMFNGQSASINDNRVRPFVTSVIPIVGDFAVAQQPVITLLPEGTNLNVTAVVSEDRKYVRLQLVPFFSEIDSVETFTFDGSTTAELTSDSILDQLLGLANNNLNLGDEGVTTQTQGVTVQQPVLSFTTVNTVVSVPDGGTVLLGGIKRMRENRREAGVPFLSSVPYVNRLFKNVGIGHETRNLMMMVTPRIIIQKEIEEDQVGGPVN
ncbi:MAG: hypothetical protein AAF939_15835, partial [Planctomycetota bacterium]